MSSRPKNLSQVSMKQKAFSLKTLRNQQTLSQHDKTEKGKDPNL
jgi:hypothetical protein